MRDKVSQKILEDVFFRPLGLNLQLMNTDSYLLSQAEVAHDVH